MKRTLIIIIAGYVAAQILADIASLRIVLIAGLSIDAGTLVYPFTFTLRDLVHKATDKRTAQTLIFSAAGINLLMAGLFYVVSELPPDPAVGEQAAFGQVLAPVFRIVLASILAEVFSELIDTEIYSLWVRRFGARLQWARVLSSNSVAIPVDSVIFVAVAFWGVLPSSVVLNLLVTNILVKAGVTLLSLPWIYMVNDKHLQNSTG